MEEGTKTKKTVFVSGISDAIDEAQLYHAFSPFGPVLEVQTPLAPTNPNQQTEAKHRGFAFVSFTSSGDAADAIDNMDNNVLRGSVLGVSLARPMAAPIKPDGNRAIWESEEWLSRHLKPLAQSGGVQGRHMQTVPENVNEHEAAQRYIV